MDNFCDSLAVRDPEIDKRSRVHNQLAQNTMSSGFTKLNTFTDSFIFLLFCQGNSSFITQDKMAKSLI